jgi:hypothetical protein
MEFIYYILGTESHRVDTEGVVEFDSAIPAPSEASPLTQWFTRAQIAAQHPDYVHAARKRLSVLGVDDHTIDAMIELRLEEIKALRLREHPKILAAFANLLEALVVARRAGAVDADDIRRIGRERSKEFLREVAKKYAGILRRVEKLDALEFSDPQLEEASRCDLYGFNRAAVVLAAASVETHLKRVTGKKGFSKYEELVEPAFWIGRLDRAQRAAATKLFGVRRRVVHEGLDPSIDQTTSMLDVARGLVESLHQNEPASDER